jgi:hypothetical protein
MIARVWHAKIENEMAPIERATVMAVLVIAVGGLALATGYKASDGPFFWYELILALVFAFLLGVTSGFSLLPRVLLGASLGAIAVGIHSAAFGRPGDLVFKSMAPDALVSMVFLTALPLVDPPAALKRASRAHTWLWPIYFLASMILMSVLFSACFLIAIVGEGQVVSHGVVSASFISIAIFLVYLRYKLPALRE